MKLWQKIYSIFFICFILTYNIAGISIIEKIHNESLHRVVNSALNDYKNMLLILDANLLKYSIAESDEYTIEPLQEFLDLYLDHFNQDKTYIEILDNKNNVIFTNFNILEQNKRDELKNLVLGKRNYIIRKIENKSYIFVSSLISVNNQRFKISHIKDISYIYEERKKQYDFFFRFEINICIVFGILMYIISKFIAKPINRLTKSTQNIAKGNYHERVKITSKDELGILSNDFNAMADAIEEKINELQKNNDEKQRFIDNLTHELKTPLTSIIGYANLLRTTKVKEETFFEAVDFIYNEGKRLEQLSLKLIDLIFLKVDAFQLKPENILELLFEVKTALIPKLKGKNIALIIEGEAYVLSVEKDLMKILISNLVDNAIKASEKDSKVYLKLYKNNEKTIFEVVDHGIGMNTEHLDKIMEPFYMIDKSRSRKYNGVGLGLSICKKITDIHHGDIEVESELNKGTRIKIIFP